MPAGKRGRPPKVRPPEEEELEEEPETAPAAAEAFDEDVLGEIDDESRWAVAVFRKISSGPRTGKPEYLGRCTPAEFSLDLVRDRFGGGTFEIRALRRDERTNREKIVRTRTVTVAGPERPIIFDGGPPPGSPIAVIGPPQSETERQLREELERSRRARVAMRRKLEELQNRPQASPLEWLEKLAPIVAPFLKPARGSGTEEFVRALELGVKLGGRGGDSDGGALGPIIDKALGVVSTIAQNGRHDASSQTAPVQAIASNGAASAGAIAQHKVMPLWLQRAQPYFGVLHAWAKSGDDPAARVGFMLSALDVQTGEELAAACEADDFVPGTLAQLPPAFREPGVVTWMTRFLQLVQEQLAPEEEVSE